MVLMTFHHQSGVMAAQPPEEMLKHMDRAVDEP
jgi:hypothetical protein